MMKKAIQYISSSILLSLCTIFIACSISYSFNGSSINYNEVKTINIDKFPIRRAYVCTPMQAMFDNRLADAYSNKSTLPIQTRHDDL